MNVIFSRLSGYEKKIPQMPGNITLFLFLLGMKGNLCIEIYKK